MPEFSVHNVRKVEIKTHTGGTGTTWTVLKITSGWEDMPEQECEVTLFHSKDGIVAPFIEEIELEAA